MGTRLAEICVQCQVGVADGGLREAALQTEPSTTQAHRRIRTKLSKTRHADVNMHGSIAGPFWALYPCKLPFASSWRHAEWGMLWDRTLKLLLVFVPTDVETSNRSCKARTCDSRSVAF